MSSRQIEIPARVEKVKPKSFNLSAKITVARNPQRWKLAFISLEISFFLSALFIKGNGSPAGKISDRRALPIVVS